jgi:hypothetical protein
MINVVSFSGGRTSAYLVHLMEERRRTEGIDVRYVFMDTGAEHPETYRFIREVVAHYGIEITCLRAKTHFKKGVGNTYTVVPLDACKPDLGPWRDMLQKYGLPYLGGAFCTERMKTVPFKKYCADTYGKGAYLTWIGIRTDEERRLKQKDGFEYLASISDYDKQDVLDFWSRQPFDLGIEEHLGNCVFCFKKSTPKVALAIKDEDAMYQQFLDMLRGPLVRDPLNANQANRVMYRGRLSLDGVAELYQDESRDDIARRVKSARVLRDWLADSGSCTESCEALSS